MKNFKLVLIILAIALLVGCNKTDTQTTNSQVEASETESQAINSQAETSETDIQTTDSQTETSEIEPDTFVFDSEEYDVQFAENAGEGVRYGSLDRLENAVCKFDDEDDPCGVIVECRVAGKSVNRTVYRYSAICDLEDGYKDIPISGKKRYVTTEIEITKIHYKGKDVTLSEGDIVNVYEHYYVLTEEEALARAMYKTDDVLDGNRVVRNLAIGSEWYPLEQGRVYILFGQYHTYELIKPSEEVKYKHHWLDYPEDQYPLIMPVGYQEAVYCISDNEPIRGTADLPYYYRDTWYDVKEKYDPSYKRPPQSEIKQPEQPIEQPPEVSVTDNS